jgi:pyruvate dehydrogenase E1 component
VQRNGEDEPNERTWLSDSKGGAVYLRLSTLMLEQPRRPMTPELERDVIDGAYWMRKPGPNAQVVVAYSGTIAPEAIKAVGLIAEDRRDIGLLAITSADRLHVGWNAAGLARENGFPMATSHVERLLSDVPSSCAIVTVLDGHPTTLSWLGSVLGHRTRALGVENFGQTGSTADLYRHFGIDAQGIISAAQMVAPGRPMRHLRRHFADG